MRGNLDLQNSTSSTSSKGPSPKVVDSESHPLTVSWIPPCDTAAGGRLGLTYCPGKHILARDGTRYCRDVRADLARLRQVHGTHAVVCLLPEAELRYLKVRDYGSRVAEHGMEYLQLPIIEMAAPSDMRLAAAAVDWAAAHVQAGRTVVMHCKGGVGRAGLMAACVLLRLGVCGSAAEAIATVRRHRRGAVESRRQEDFVAAYCGSLAAERPGPGHVPANGGGKGAERPEGGSQGPGGSGGEPAAAGGGGDGSGGEVKEQGGEG
ncbi:Cyclin-dependent kinase inhibitor 3 [Pleodorina starrii]|uniref:Cyclin-dependent kinase inhibitor 3 n=1 Tax=Pleodorina starrii TaxID=330485 RepID=A0A9W6BG17_9CHLO|nr:Cyclin-dependent kinase inhibitor 3 [Pleodorina starrii]GLC50932.1 Cyclin-dependent kinase inhibitor 3 [Pleodorina starrii]GLC69872.1 Cyclin-dependent kinase inhibitor 3 [Pleodorina starrii]